MHVVLFLVSGRISDGGVGDARCLEKQMMSMTKFTPIGSDGEHQDTRTTYTQVMWFANPNAVVKGCPLATVAFMVKTPQT